MMTGQTTRWTECHPGRDLHVMVGRKLPPSARSLCCKPAMEQHFFFGNFNLPKKKRKKKKQQQEDFCPAPANNNQLQEAPFGGKNSECLSNMGSCKNLSRKKKPSITKTPPTPSLHTFCRVLANSKSPSNSGKSISGLSTAAEESGSHQTRVGAEGAPAPGRKSVQMLNVNSRVEETPPPSLFVWF